MIIKSFEGGFDKNYCYLIWCKETKYAAIIDPATNPIPILETIENLNLKLSKIIITHTHFDHIKFLDDYLYYYPTIQINCHEKSKQIFKLNNTLGLCDNETISLGEILIISLFTPGHYFDSICYWIKNNNLLFTGDTVFVGRPGRTISKTSNINDLFDSIYSKIFSLPEDTLILPGHHYGYKKTITIKENKLISKFFSCNSFEEFKNTMHKFESNYKK